MYKIKVVMKYESFSNISELWNLLVSNHSSFGDSNVIDVRTGSSVCFKNYAGYLEKNRMSDFMAEFCGGSITYGDSFNSNLAKLDITNLASNETDVENWISLLLLDDRFVQAHIYDAEYDLWQNMEDLKYYESENRSYEGLPLKSNGLPFPLEQKIIDTSNNSGRLIFKIGYIEAIGSTMWLGKQFLKKTAVSKEKILACDWLHSEEIGNIIKLKVQDVPFTNADGQEEILQKKLRNLLYTK